MAWSAEGRLEWLTVVISGDRWSSTSHACSSTRRSAPLRDVAGNTHRLEEALSQIHAATPAALRQQAYRNLRDVATKSGAIARLPKRVADLLADLPAG